VGDEHAEIIVVVIKELILESAALPPIGRHHKLPQDDLRLCATSDVGRSATILEVAGQLLSVPQWRRQPLSDDPQTNARDGGDKTGDAFHDHQVYGSS
jgi:hypothetical protein